LLGPERLHGVELRRIHPVSALPCRWEVGSGGGGGGAARFPLIKFLALRAITAGEELLWDYGPSYWEAYRANRTVQEAFSESSSEEYD
jgi:hypothetical protein